MRCAAKDIELQGLLGNNRVWAQTVEARQPGVFTLLL